MLYGIMLRNKTGGVKLAGAAVARGLAEHRSVGGEQLCSFASLVFLGFIFLSFCCCFFFFFLAIVF